MKPAGLIAVLGAAALACAAEGDLSSGRAYACDPSAGDRDGAPQCTEGWRCAATGLCVEVAAGTRSACVRDEDCSGGFICGRERLCRDPRVNGPYQCEGDFDCGPSWVCGLAGRCEDPALEAPSPEAPFALLASAEQLSPVALPPEAPLSVSRLADRGQYVVSRAEGRTLSSFAIADWNVRSGFQRGELRLGLSYHPTTAVTRELPSEPLALGALLPDATVALLPEGLHVSDGGYAFVDERLAGMEQLAVFPDPRPAFGHFAAWNETSLAAGVVQDVGVTLFPLVTGGGGVVAAPPATVLQDVAVFRYVQDGSGGAAVAAVTDRGLYVRYAGEGQSWLAVAAGPLGHADCGAGPGLRPESVIDTGLGSTYRLQLIARPTDGGTSRYGVQLETNAPRRPEGCDGWIGVGALGVTRPACPLCPDGATLVGAWRGRVAGSFQTRCDAEGAQRSFTVSAEDCAVVEHDEPAGLQPVTTPSTVRDVKAWLGSDGRLYGPAGLDERAQAVPLSRPPAELLRVRGVLSASLPAPGASREEFVEVEGFGLVRSTLANDRPLPAGQEVSPRFVIDRNGRAIRDGRGWEDGGVPERVAVLDPTVTEGLQEPASLHALPRPDGGTTLVVTSADVLLSAALGADPAGLEPPVLAPRISPSPGTVIRDAVFVEPTVGGLVEGYLLSDSEVRFVLAETDQRWESRRLAVPEGDWIALWREGGRARIGYRDGRVYSLPGRYPLAPPFKTEQVFDYASLCNRTYAATSAGLRRLEPTGRWIAEPAFAATLAQLGEQELQDGRLFTGVGELFWAGGAGTLVRLVVGDACPEEVWP